MTATARQVDYALDLIARQVESLAAMEPKDRRSWTWIRIPSTVKYDIDDTKAARREAIDAAIAAEDAYYAGLTRETVETMSRDEISALITRLR